jgi:hypothetical protein
MWCCPQCRAFLAHRRGSITFPLCSRLLSPRRRAKNALHYAHGWQIALQIALQVRSEHGGERRRKGEKVGYEEPTTYSKTAHFVIGRSRVQLSPSAPNSMKTNAFLKAVTYRRAGFLSGSIKVPLFF